MTTGHLRRAAIVVHPAYTVADIDRRLFGSFVEHLGRGVYGGIFDPHHPLSDGNGFRRDVLDLVQELGVTTVRYPGGNFVSAYDWRDGVGPRAERPTRLDPAWHSVETNAFGLDEFVAWCRAAHVEPMLAVNLGTAGIRSALQQLEYANHPSGTTLSDERRANGADEPHDITLWCLGNEMDGPWQIGHMDAIAYGKLAAATGAAMRAIDPRLELVVCGSSNDRMDTFATWEREVLTQTIDLVDYISCHQYFRNDGDLDAFLASGVAMDRFIDTVSATIAHVKAATGSTRDVAISFDEWNVWDYVAHDEIAARGLAWDTAPALLEDRYTVADAVVVGDMLISLLNHSDVVRAASLAQLVNVIGPIVAPEEGDAWRQTTFWPFADARVAAGRTALRVAVEADGCTSAIGAGEPVPVVAAAAAWDERTGKLSVFLVNRSIDAPTTVRVDLSAFVGVALVAARTLTHDDPLAGNTDDQPNRVAPAELPAAVVDGVLELLAPAVSWCVVHLMVDVHGR
ncbi:arabinosylfuranosidase ArfA [Microbacterium sp. Leaf179]|uniref:arabinosylfuranosidase ArfA n=1 Tax=Microbacterium sp. Leaf179 TaxID=1736288 RepID=UPI000AAC0EB8|nr:alpha-L-arabinofuranosidase C-terminal domain-containing protein [Microbacterium sp. Leaf179]